jgi:hypothetical protein
LIADLNLPQALTWRPIDILVTTFPLTWEDSWPASINHKIGGRNWCRARCTIKARIVFKTILEAALVFLPSTHKYNRCPWKVKGKVQSTSSRVHKTLSSSPLSKTILLKSLCNASWINEESW